MALAGVMASVGSHYHLLGTDKVGEDVLYQALKSIRTGLVIGTVTTAGYGGRVAWISMLLVDPAHRGQGMGTRLPSRKWRLASSRASDQAVVRASVE